MNLTYVSQSAEILLSRGAKITPALVEILTEPLHISASKLVKLVAVSGLVNHQSEQRGPTLLYMYAIYTELFSFLLNHGADVC